MNNLDTISTMGYSIFADKLDTIKLISDNTAQVVNTINAYSYVMAKSDKDFNLALTHCDFLVPDGFPVVLAARLLNGRRIKKIAGADVFFHFCNKLNKVGGSCFFMGASEKTLSKIKERLVLDFPNLKTGFYSPPFKKEFTPEDNRIMLEQIEKFNPDVLFVGMTAPKQEKWVHQHKLLIKAKIVTSIGAVFDFYAGTVSRPSPLWIKLNLEWFIRLIKEPKRLWKRYLIYSPIFIIDLFLYFIRVKKS